MSKIIDSMTEKSVQIHKVFRKITGCWDSALMLSLIFDNDGWLEIEPSHIENLTGLTKPEQDKSLSSLKTNGLIWEKLSGQTLSYSADTSAIVSCINSITAGKR